jgi:hypothetical protein
VIQLQSSLNAFDSSKKKEIWKVIILKGKSKTVIYKEAYSAEELKAAYPDASNIIKIEKRNNGDKNCILNN